MNNKKRITILLLLVIFPPILIVLSHTFFPSNYFFSSIYKIIFLAPLFFNIYVEKKSFKQALLKDFSFSDFRRNFFRMFIVGFILSIVYLSGFFIFKDFIDFKLITEKINELATINLNNIVFIGLYIIIFNSILEEYFWRSFIFAELHKTIRPSLAYIISAVAFSFHHVVFFYSWFTPIFFILITVGLITYALIMNFIWNKYRELFSCWLPHAMVDIVQVFIAWQVFSLI